MSDRLDELKRQRTLAQEQLAWLDREIARETGQTPAPAAPSPAPASVTAPQRAAISDEEAAHAAQEIIAQYEKPAGSMTQDVRRGCFLAFFFALGAVVLLAVTAYIIYTRRG